MVIDAYMTCVTWARNEERGKIVNCIDRQTTWQKFWCHQRAHKKSQALATTVLYKVEQLNSGEIRFWIQLPSDKSYRTTPMGVTIRHKCVYILLRLIKLALSMITCPYYYLSLMEPNSIADKTVKNNLNPVIKILMLALAQQNTQSV